MRSDPDEFECIDKRESVIDMLDLVEACCNTQRDLDIVRLRQAGLTDSETGKKLGISESTVIRSRHAIEARFEAKQAALSA